MVKNKFGGNKAKKGASKNQIDTGKVEVPDNEQYFGVITKVLGGGRFNVEYFKSKKVKADGIETIEYDKNSKQATIRGKMRKKVWVNLNDIVLVTERDYDNNIDIIERYTPLQVENLKKMDLLSFLDDGIVDFE